MTQFRRDPENISNWFDIIFAGIGHRNSSFMNLDAVFHDGDSHRFLFHEYKHWGEVLKPNALWLYRDLAKSPNHTVWIIWKPDHASHPYRLFVLPKRTPEFVTVTQLQARLRTWWNNGQQQAAV